MMSSDIDTQTIREVAGAGQSTYPPYPVVPNKVVLQLCDALDAERTNAAKAWGEVGRLRKLITDDGWCPDCGLSLKVTGCGHG